MTGTVFEFDPVLAVGRSNAALFTFFVYTLAVFGLAALSNRLMKKKNFLSEYFLGSRSLGVWAFALTFAATSASGGSFTGFPSRIYTHGWVLGLWIGSYVVFPICAMGLLGKRLNHMARKSGAITVPDVLRDRFQSPIFALLAVSLIVFFMSFNLVAQFKAGSMILQTLLQGVEIFETTAVQLSHLTGEFMIFSGIDPQYLLCLLGFSLAVIFYTTYGGFHAVVWTDVMQGLVMVFGVLLMLPLAISAIGPGGLKTATRDMIAMTPPKKGTATIVLQNKQNDNFTTQAETWIALDKNDLEKRRVFRLGETLIIPAGETHKDDVKILEITSPHEVKRILDGDDIRDALEIRPNLTLENIQTESYAYGAEENRKGVYVTGPGPDPDSDSGFLPLSLAISFFFMWAISGAGQPSSMVRLMAFNSSLTLRRSIFTVAIYYSMIYFPLVIIFCCARILIPGMEAETDRIMPAMAVFLTENAGVGWLAGLLVAAPFAAVMSTVDSFLLMISSALVRDIYQRNFNPKAREKTLRRLSYLFTLLVGTGAMLGAVNPPQFLQDIIVYTGSGLAACFLAPMVFALYSPRANVQGCMAGMLAGFTAHIAMYYGGIFTNGSFFKPYKLMNFDPIIVGLFVSFLANYLVTKFGPPPPQELVRKYFYKKND